MTATAERPLPRGGGYNLVAAAILATSIAALAILLLLPAATASFVVVGSTSATSGAIDSSDNGASWNPHTLPATPATSSYQDAANDGANWVVVGWGILTSPGPQPPSGAWTWTVQCGFNQAGCPTTQTIGAGGSVSWSRLDAVAYGGGVWVAVGGTGNCAPACTYTGQISTSTNGGVTWTTQTEPQYLNAVAFDGTNWVAGGNDGFMVTTTNPTGTWTPINSGMTGFIWDIATDGTRWVYVSGPNVNYVGGTWTSATSAWNWVQADAIKHTGVAYGNGRWTAVGTTSAYVANGLGVPGTYTSTTGTSFTLTNTQEGAKVAYDGCEWVASVAVPGNPPPPTSPMRFSATGTGSWTTTTTGGTHLMGVGAQTCPPTCSPATQNIVAGASASLTAAGGTPGYTWSGPSGSPATGSGSSYSPTYSTAGTYTVTLTDSSPPAQSTTCTVNVIPVLTCSVPAVVDGSTSTATRSGGTPPYSWSAPGNAAGSGNTYTATFTAPGDTITVTNANPAQTATCNALVAPVMTCAPASQDVVEGTPASLNAIGGTTPFTWTSPGVANGAGTTYAPTFAAGAHTVTLSNSVPAQTATCQVNAIPVLACQDSPQTVLIDTWTTFGATGGTGQYAWDAPGGTPDTGTGNAGSNTFSNTYPTGGSRTITLTDLGPPAQTTTCTVNVEWPPVVCAPNGLNVTMNAATLFTATGGDGNYQWISPSATPSTGTAHNYTASWPDAGIYLVTVSSAGQSSTCGIQVMPPPPPPPPPSLPYPETPMVFPGSTSSPPTPVIHGQPVCGVWTVRFDGSASSDVDGLVTDWHWTFGDDKAATGMVVTHTYPGPGTYPLKLTVHDDNGLSATRGLDVNLLACTALAVTSTPATAQPGQTVTSCVHATGGQPPYTFSVQTGTQPGALPPGASFNSGTGCLAWTPTAEQAGNTCTQIEATDGTATATNSLCIDVVVPAVVKDTIDTGTGPVGTQEPPPLVAPSKSIIAETPQATAPNAPAIAEPGVSWLMLVAVILGLTMLAFGAGIGFIKIQNRKQAEAAEIAALYPWAA